MRNETVQPRQLSVEELARLDDAILAFSDPTHPQHAEIRGRFEESQRRIGEQLQPILDAIRRSEQLTAEDYNVTILPLND